MLISTAHLSREEVEALTGTPDMVLVSITDPETPAPRLLGSFREVLVTAFWDVTAPMQLEGEWLPPIQDWQAREIVDFLERWHRAPEAFHLVCHCEAGVSRSAAVARFAAERYGLPLPHDAAYPFANAAVLNRLWYVANG